MIGDIWDWFIETLGEAGEFMMGLFEGLGEFSPVGAVFGLLAGGFLFAVRNQMLNPFLKHMGSVEAIIWGGLTYIITIIAGYLIGKKIFEE